MAPSGQSTTGNESSTDISKGFAPGGNNQGQQVPVILKRKNTQQQAHQNQEKGKK